MVFGLGAPLAARVGTAVGAGDTARARQVAWTGAVIAGLLAECIGLAAALRPEVWLHLFDQDSGMLAVGALYLRLVGPFYGLFGVGLALYFAAQGAGQVGWPLVAGLLRVTVALGGGFLALHLGYGLEGLFLALGAGLATLAFINAGALASGAWLGRSRTSTAPPPAPHRA